MAIVVLRGRSRPQMLGVGGQGPMTSLPKVFPLASAPINGAVVCRRWRVTGSPGRCGLWPEGEGLYSFIHSPVYPQIFIKPCCVLGAV